ncbi:hypothetical protein BH23BAC1_BH23BAC1_04330 [soil metagenome]
MTFDLDIGKFNRDFSNTLVTATIISDDPVGLEGLINRMPTNIDIRTIKADFSRSFFKNWKMETGFKSSSVRSDNDMTLSSGLVGELVLDTELSNHFQYSEQVNAMYTSISGKPTVSTEMQVGLRVEHTHSIGHSLTMDQKVALNYLNFFPSFFATKKLSEKQSFTLS